MSHDLEQNKNNAKAFYDLMFNQCQPREAIEKYAGDVYIQHNPRSLMARRLLLSISNECRQAVQASRLNLYVH